MDSVIVYFGAATYQQVEAAFASHGLRNDNVVRGGLQFHLWRHEEWRTELDSEEKVKLKAILGSEPESAFQIIVKHDQSARFALEVLSQVMKALGASAIDDDQGGLWPYFEVDACLTSSEESSIYSLREWANHAHQPTGHKAGPRLS